MAIDQSVIVEYRMAQKLEDDSYWLFVLVNGAPHDEIGPFNTQDECERAWEDLSASLMAHGGIALPASKATLN